MKRTTGVARLGLAMIACACAHCGRGAEAPTTFPTAGDVSVLFTEDADPSIASLPSVADELLIQPFPGADVLDLSNLFDEIGAQIAGKLGSIEVTILRVPADKLSILATRLAESSLIEIVQKNYLLTAGKIPSDPDYPRQRHLAQLDFPTVWDSTTGDATTIVAVVDTGVDPNHPDLIGRLLPGWNVADDNDEFADVIGHGTMVAGILGASTDNALGVAGVTWKNPVLPIRASGRRGEASSSNIAAGILWAVDNGARAINVSFAPLWSNRVVRAAAREAFNRGSLVVISAGNTGEKITSQGFAEALFVGGVDHANELAVFSTQGAFVDIVAPAVGIRSTQRGGDYVVASGTSFAAPIVTGVAALCWSMNDNLRPATIRDILIETATDLGSFGKDESFGWGVINVGAAVDRAGGTARAVDNTSPVLMIVFPTEGATLSGRSVVRVGATDRWGVADVVMLVDGIAFATDTRAPYRLVIDTGRFSSGEHEITFVATDLAGNASAPRSVKVNFGSSSRRTSGVSTIVFTSPRSRALVSGEVLIEAELGNRQGLATVEWFIDGEPRLSVPVGGQSAEASLLWRTEGIEPGSHFVTAIVTDARGGRTVGRLELRTR